MLVIAEITLFFDDSSLEVAIGLSLTIMLVMYTMYDSISKTSPMTAYLKMIDLWLLFCLFIPFAIFMIEIIWFLKHKKLMASRENLRLKKKKKSSPDRRLVKTVVPAITILFVTGYFLSAIVLMNKPQLND